MHRHWLCLDSLVDLQISLDIEGPRFALVRRVKWGNRQQIQILQFKFDKWFRHTISLIRWIGRERRLVSDISVAFVDHGQCVVDREVARWLLNVVIEVPNDRIALFNYYAFKLLQTHSKISDVAVQDFYVERDDLISRNRYQF